MVTVSFTCTETEKVALQAVSASVDEAITMVTLEVAHVQETLIGKFSFFKVVHFNVFL